MSNTTEMLKVHGFTKLDETASDASDTFIRNMNAILPGTMFAVYDASDDNPGYYVVEYVELTEYETA